MKISVVAKNATTGADGKINEDSYLRCKKRSILFLTLPSQPMSEYARIRPFLLIDARSYSRGLARPPNP